MQCEAARERLVGGLIGAAPDEDAELRQHLAECAACRGESTSLAHLWDTLGPLEGDPPDAAASARMRARLDGLLDAHAARPASRRFGYAFQPVAALLVLALGIGLGMGLGMGIARDPAAPSPELGALHQELQDLRHMVTLSLMQQQSATDRLKGVSWSGQIDAPGNDVVQALLDALTNDPNVNVRLASLDALERFADREPVRRAALDAVETQMSPLVQIALIDFIVKTGERGSLDVLKRMAGDPQVHQAVRERATWGVRTLG